MFTISTTPARTLPEADISRWKALLAVNPNLDSPYFQPEFTQAVAEVRSDVEVAVIRDNDNVVGYFPFQRGRFNIGYPVCGRMSDFHGFIAAPEESISLVDVVRECGLRAFHFDHLLIQNRSWVSSENHPTCGSPYIDMANGFQDYLALQKSYSKQVGEYLRKRNKLEREHGKIVTEFDSGSEQDFQQLIEWKVNQYSRTGAFNPFRFPWTLELLRNLWALKSDSLRGVLSTIRISGELVGAHFGMRSHGTLHYWFPAYNPDYQKYSPGNILLLETAEAGSERGIRKIDLGKGTESYKLCFGSAQSLVTEGSILLPSLGNYLSGRVFSAKEWLKSSPLRTPALMTAGLLRPVREWLAFR